MCQLHAGGSPRRRTIEPSVHARAVVKARWRNRVSLGGQRHAAYGSTRMSVLGPVLPGCSTNAPIERQGTPLVPQAAGPVWLASASPGLLEESSFYRGRDGCARLLRVG